MKERHITVVSLGPGDERYLTLETAEILRKKSRTLLLRTSRHRAVRWLDAQSIPYESLDALYDQYEDFDEMHQEMARRIWQAAEAAEVTFAVPDPLTDGAVQALYALRPEGGAVTVVSGVSAADTCLSRLPEDVVHPGMITILPASMMADSEPDPNQPLLITEIDSRMLASDLKLKLTEIYGDEQACVFFPTSAKVNRKAMPITLMELDRQASYDHTVCVYLPASGFAARPRSTFRDLRMLMHFLRQNCPWDSQQTHESLRKYLIEEAWETADAIVEDDPEHMAEELGDVLLQVAFHADIAESFGEFSMADVTSAIVQKMVYRHAHLFGGQQCSSAGQVEDLWEAMKKAERRQTTQQEVLRSVSTGMPALMRADKVQKKAAKVGFDWDNALGALEKVHEEADEVRAELVAHRDPAEEVGDLLFSCVNTARLAGVDPEYALKKATDKFINRFSAMENLIISDGKSLEGLTLAEMDVYWNRVKAEQKASF